MFSEKDKIEFKYDNKISSKENKYELLVVNPEAKKCGVYFYVKGETTYEELLKNCGAQKNQRAVIYDGSYEGMLRFKAQECIVVDQNEPVSKQNEFRRMTLVLVIPNEPIENVKYSLKKM